MKSIVDKIYAKATKENLLYAAGIVSVLYITKSTLGLFSSFFKNNNKNKEIKAILEKEKTKLMADPSQFSKYDISYLLYLKILNTVFREEFSEFNKNRLKIFNADNIYKYINCVERFLRDLKLIEQEILQIVFNDLKIDSESREIEFDFDKINISELKRKYFCDLNLEIPKSLDKNKICEIINILYDKTKYYLTKLREHFSKNEDYINDKLQLLAEYMSFDFIYQKYGIERNVIEKAMCEFDLTIIEK